MNVAGLFALFGVKVDRASWARADAVLNASSAKTAALEKQLAGVYQDSAGRLRQANGRFVAADSELKAEWVKRNGAAADAVKNKHKKTAKRLKEVWGGVQKVLFGALAVTGAVYGFTRLADAYNGASSKIRQMTDDTAQQVQIQDALFKSAQDTGSEFGDVVSLFQQVGKAAKDAGHSYEEAEQYVDTITKAIKASGASSEGASAALTQLAQGLGSGTLRGEEFNSVIEQAPFLIDLLAKSMGKTRGQMRKLAQSGKLTSEVIFKALEQQKGAVDEAFAKRIPLFTEGFTRMRNEITKTLGELAQRKDVAKAFATVFSGLSKAIVGFIKAFAAMVVFFVGHQKTFAAALIALIALGTYLGQTFAVAWLAMLGPIALVIAAVVAFAYYFEDLVVLLAAGVEQVVDAFIWIGSQFSRLWRGIKNIFGSIVRFFQSIGSAIRSAMSAVFDWVAHKLQWVIDKANWLIDKVGRVTSAVGVDLGSIPNVVDRPTKTAANNGSGANTYAPNIKIDVQSNAADGASVASATVNAFDTYWRRQLRNASDSAGVA